MVPFRSAGLHNRRFDFSRSIFHPEVADNFNTYYNNPHSSFSNKCRRIQIENKESLVVKISGCSLVG